MSQSQEEMLKQFVTELFDKYDTQRKGTLNTEELCMLFNDMFQSLGVQLTINAYQVTKAIQLINPQFSDSATKEQAYETFKSMINYSQNNPMPSQPQPQMTSPYMMQMGYNPMMAQYYGQSQYGANYMGYSQNQYNQGQYNQNSYNQWPYGNFQNNYPR